MVTEDFALFVPNQEPIWGQPAAKERLGWLLGHPESRFICEKQEVLEAVALSEDAGYSTQMMHMYNGVDKSKRYRAKCLTLWKKIDGVWMIYRESSSPCPQQ